MRGVALGLALLTLQALPLAAQTRLLRPGEDVRLFVSGIISPFEGVLLSADDRSLTIASLDGSEMSIPRDQIERSEVLAQRRNTALGAAVGVGVGLAAGVGVLVASDDDCTRDASGFCDPGETFNHWLLIGPAALGAGLGALTGSVITSGRWVPAFLPAAGNGSPGLELAWSLPTGW